MQQFIMAHGHANDKMGNLSTFTRQRLDSALTVKQQFPDAKMIASGGIGHFNLTNQPHSVYIKQYWMEKGVAASDIIRFDTPQHTVDEIAILRHYLSKIPKATCWIISSDFHLPRIEFICRCLLKNTILHFIGSDSPDKSETKYQHAVEHEQKSFARLKEQGGVILDGALFHP